MYQYTATVVPADGKVVEELNNFAQEGWRMVFMESFKQRNRAKTGSEICYRIVFEKLADAE